MWQHKEKLKGCELVTAMFWWETVNINKTET